MFNRQDLNTSSNLVHGKGINNAKNSKRPTQNKNPQEESDSNNEQRRPGQ